MTIKGYFCNAKPNFFGREGLDNRDSCVIVILSHKWL